MCDMTHPYVWHDPFIHALRDAYVLRDSFICVTWLFHMCYTTHSYPFICVTTLIYTDLVYMVPYSDLIYTWLRIVYHSTINRPQSERQIRATDRAYIAGLIIHRIYFAVLLCCALSHTRIVLHSTRNGPEFVRQIRPPEIKVVLENQNLGIFRSCWYSRIDNFVAQIIALCGFQKILWYKIIVCFVPLYRVLSRHRIRSRLLV